MRKIARSVFLVLLSTVTLGGCNLVRGPDAESPTKHRVDRSLRQVVTRLCLAGQQSLPTLIGKQDSLHREFNAALDDLHKEGFLVRARGSVTGVVGLSGMKGAGKFHPPGRRGLLPGAEACDALLSRVIEANEARVQEDGYGVTYATGGLRLNTTRSSGEIIAVDHHHHHAGDEGGFDVDEDATAASHLLLEGTCGRCKGKGYVIGDETDGNGNSGSAINNNNLGEASRFMARYRSAGMPLVEYDDDGEWRGPAWQVENSLGVDASGADFDQGNMFAEDVAMRLRFMDERGDLRGKSILVIGDDDLFSVAAALTGLPRRIVVLEIDGRLVKLLNAIAKSRGLPIEARHADMQLPLGDDLIGQFDVFVGDPVETLPGLTVFLSRGAAALRPEAGKVGYFGLTTVEAGVTKYREMELMLTRAGWAPTDIRRRMSDYPCTATDTEDIQMLTIVSSSPRKSFLSRCDYPWYKSSFIRLEAVRALNPPLGPKQQTNYTGLQLICDDESYCDDDEAFAGAGAHRRAGEQRRTWNATAAVREPSKLTTADVTRIDREMVAYASSGAVVSRARSQVLRSVRRRAPNPVPFGAVARETDGTLALLQQAIADLASMGLVSLAREGGFELVASECPRDDAALLLAPRGSHAGELVTRALRYRGPRKEKVPTEGPLPHARVETTAEPCPVCGGKGTHTHQALVDRLMPPSPTEPWVPRWSANAGKRWVVPGAARARGLEGPAEGVMFPRDVVDRVSFLMRAGDLASRSLLVLGDDDYLSIAAARTGLPNLVQVLDVSEEVVSVVGMTAVQEKHDTKDAATFLRADLHDLRKPLPRRLRGAFDVVVFEPDTTLRAIELWLSRAAAALRPVATSTVYMGISAREMSPRKLLEIERMLLEAGFSVTDIFRDFSTYPCDSKQDAEDVRRTTLLDGARYDRCDVDGWYRSTLIRAELVNNEVSFPIPAAAEAEGLTPVEWWCDAETYCPALAAGTTPGSWGGAARTTAQAQSDNDDDE